MRFSTFSVPVLSESIVRATKLTQAYSGYDVTNGVLRLISSPGLSCLVDSKLVIINNI